MKRGRMTISLSPKNEDAALVARALEQAPERQRSALLLRWAAAHLSGETAAPAQPREWNPNEADIDAAIDDW